jgi:hypothetical protein
MGESKPTPQQQKQMYASGEPLSQNLFALNPALLQSMMKPKLVTSLKADSLDDRLTSP